MKAVINYFLCVCVSQALRNTDNRVSLIWKHQLMQFNNISESMASAVVASWPSPAHLFKVSVRSIIDTTVSCIVLKFLCELFY